MRSLLLLLLAGAAHASGLTREQADVVRRALAKDPPPATVPELVAAAAALEPSLSGKDLEALEAMLREDVATRRAVAWLLESAPGGETLEAGPFLISWQAAQRDELGQPSAPPSADEVAAMAQVLRQACAWLDTPVPARIPYRVDRHASTARVFPPRDPRWGVVTPRTMDAVSVAKVALLEVGDVPYLVEPLALLLGRCGDSAECRRKLFAEARESVARGTYVPVLDGLEAGALHGPDDPALASALLVVEHLQRLHSPRTLAALLRAVRRDAPVDQARRVFEDVAGEGVRSVDHEVLRGVQEWAVAREREAAGRGRTDRTLHPRR